MVQEVKKKNDYSRPLYCEHSCYNTLLFTYSGVLSRKSKSFMLLIRSKFYPRAASPREQSPLTNVFESDQGRDSGNYFGYIKRSYEVWQQKLIRPG